jgi:hypothetical protein
MVNASQRITQGLQGGGTGPDVAAVLLLSRCDWRAGPASRILVSYGRRIGRRLPPIPDNGQRFAWRLSCGALPVFNTVILGPPRVLVTSGHGNRPTGHSLLTQLRTRYTGPRALFMFGLPGMSGGPGNRRRVRAGGSRHTVPGLLAGAGTGAPRTRPGPAGPPHRAGPAAGAATGPWLSMRSERMSGRCSWACTAAGGCGAALSRPVRGPGWPGRAGPRGGPGRPLLGPPGEPGARRG